MAALEFARFIRAAISAPDHSMGLTYGVDLIETPAGGGV